MANSVTQTQFEDITNDFRVWIDEFTDHITKIGELRAKNPSSLYTDSKALNYEEIGKAARECLEAFGDISVQLKNPPITFDGQLEEVKNLNNNLNGILSAA